MQILKMVPGFLLTLALVACGRGAPSSDGAGTAPAANIPAPASKKGASTASRSTGIWFEPAALSECGSGKDVVKVHWNVTGMAGVNAVKIVPIEKGQPAGIFGVSGAKGSKDTGPWMHSGGTMAVLDAANDEEIARATIGSVPCGN